MTEGIDLAGDGSSRAWSAGGVGPRFALIFAVAIGVTLAATLVVLDRIGVGSRTLPSDGPRVVVVEDSTDLFAAWNEAGVNGAALVDVTRDLGYTPIPFAALPNAAGWPVPVQDLHSAFVEGADRRTVVWVASKTGVARTVHYVLEPSDLADKVSAGRANGFPGIAPDGGSITANDDGYLRLIDDEFPVSALDGAVLNIDASYFVRGTPEALARRLQDSPSRYALITLDRATDATDVPEVARRGLDRMAVMLREGEAR